MSISILLGIFALGPEIKFLGEPLCANPLVWLLTHIKLKSLITIFRMPGRFIWPLHYLILALGIRSLDRKPILLTLLLVIQLLDIGDFIAAKNYHTAVGAHTRILENHKVMEKLNRAEEIRFIPLEPRTICHYQANDYSREIFTDIFRFAAEKGLPINSGMQARIPSKIIEPLCEAELTDFKNRKFIDGVAYILAADVLDKEILFDIPPLSCVEFKATFVCMTDSSSNKLH